MHIQAEGRPPAHKQWSLCVFDDLLEYASSNAGKYKEFFLQPMLKCVCDKSPPVRQVRVLWAGGVRVNVLPCVHAGCKLWDWSDGSILCKGLQPSLFR